MHLWHPTPFSSVETWLQPVEFSWNLQLAFIGLRPIRALFSIDSMTFTSIRHAHSHHGLTGRGALLRVHVRL